eukprot:gene9474-6651_t
MDDELFLQLNEPETYTSPESGSGPGVISTSPNGPEEDTNLDSEDIWEVISSFFREKGLVHQQLDSYNSFSSEFLTQFDPGVEMSEPEQTLISFENVVIEIRHIPSAVTDMAQVTLRLRVFRPNEEEPRQSLQSVELGRIPIMLKSVRCNLEGRTKTSFLGGYFVINGTESHRGGVPEQTQDASNYDALQKVAPAADLKTHVPCVAQMDETIPLLPERYGDAGPLRGSIEDASSLGIFTRDDALWHIGKRLGHQDSRDNLQREAESLLMTDLLPHMGTDPSSNRGKCLYMGYMVHRLLLVALGRREDTDRDFVGYKRIDVAGALLTFQLHVFSTGRALHSKLITDGLRRCLATGNFGDLKSGAIKTGVSQTLNRLTYSSSLSNLRRVQNPIASSSKATRPRNLHCSQWGYICPVETPEGGSIGLLKNVALMCLMSRGTDHTDVVQAVQARISGFHSVGLEDLANVHVSRTAMLGNFYEIFGPDAEGAEQRD